MRARAASARARRACQNKIHQPSKDIYFNQLSFHQLNSTGEARQKGAIKV
jgi:hypothetical protein